MNGTRPHPRFRYPESAFPQDLDADLGREFAQLFAGNIGVPLEVSLRPTLLATLERYVEARQLAPGFRVAIQYPCPAEFLAVARAQKAEILELPRDPDDWATFDFASLDECWLSTPSSVDGFFYPQTLFSSLLRELAPHKEVHVLSEESAAVFSFNQESPGSVRTLMSDARISLLSSLYPVLNPQGPQVSWLLRPAAQTTASVENISSEDLKKAYAVVLAFLSRQGASFGEFTRRMIAVDHGLRRFTDALKPALAANALKAVNWPETGFHMLFDCPAWGGDPSTTETECLRLASEQGLRVTPGTLFGRPGSFQICYAAPHLVLDDMAARLLQFFGFNLSPQTP